MANTIVPKRNYGYFPGDDKRTGKDFPFNFPPLLNIGYRT